MRYSELEYPEDKYCSCRGNHVEPILKYQHSIDYHVSRRTCKEVGKDCRACGKRKLMPVSRYWCDECFYTAHGWC